MPTARSNEASCFRRKVLWVYGREVSGRSVEFVVAVCLHWNAQTFEMRVPFA